MFRPPRLPVVQRGAAVRLAEAIQRREPGVDVVHPELTEPHVPGRALHDLIMQPEVLEYLFRAGQQHLTPAGGLVSVGLADNELLNLLELVDPQQSAHITARAAYLTPETRRDTGIKNRQAGLFQDLAGGQPHQRGLGGGRAGKNNGRELFWFPPGPPGNAPPPQSGALFEGRCWGSRGVSS